METPVNEAYKAISLLVPQAKTSTFSSTGVSVEAYENDAMVVLHVGAVSGTTPTLDVVVEGSDTVGGTYTTLATFGQVTAANKIGAVSINIGASTAKFIRITGTIGGSSPSFTMSATLLAENTVRQSGLNASTPA